MRNKYSKEFENEMKALSKENTLNELLDIAKNKYKYQISKKNLLEYLSKRKIRYKGYNEKKIREYKNPKPLFSERVKNDGMVQIKIAKDKWEYKQRYIYSKYHNVKLTNDDYIIFLDQDRTNFNIDNLYLVSRRESSILANQKIFSKNPNVTKVGIEIAKLIIKSKDRKEQINEKIIWVTWIPKY